jgi:hypothetical protein
MQPMRHWLGAALVALLLPLAGLAEDPAAKAPKPATAADAGAPSAAETPEAAKKTRAFTGLIRKVSGTEIVVQQIGNNRKLKSQPLLKVPGGVGTPVSGEGKNSWLKLRKGDLVAVAFRPGPPPETLKVLVLPPTALPQVAKTLGKTPRKGRREFTGWIKFKDDSRLVVRTPDAAPPSKRKGETKTFIRTESTTVEMLRSSWDALEKGDRVSIHFDKGDPRPIKTLAVVTRGGENPLPPGLATRLFDPEYDESVKDVDGIGETEPLPTAASGATP